MMRLLPIFLGFLLLAGNGATAWAASAKATALRQANGLTAFTPPEKFLAGKFRGRRNESRRSFSGR